jgi:predicted S18 family serine protease
MPEYKVDLTDEQVQALQELARRRGLKMNEVLQQAISTEKLIADNVEEGDDLLIKKGDRFKKVVFDSKK